MWCRYRPMVYSLEPEFLRDNKSRCDCNEYARAGMFDISRTFKLSVLMPCTIMTFCPNKKFYRKDKCISIARGELLKHYLSTSVCIHTELKLCT